MSDINYKELFEHYYQKDYDFNTSSLSAEQIKDIKQTARQMRVDYALAPMGTSIFNWILNQNSNIRFELVPFDSENIDGVNKVNENTSDSNTSDVADDSIDRLLDAANKDNQDVLCNFLILFPF